MAADQTNDTPVAARLAWLDMVRGTAVLGMIVFHAGWDVADQGLLGERTGVGQAWQAFGDVLAAVFLAVSGFSLVQARLRGVHLGHMVRRIGLVFAAATALTIGSCIVAPGGGIYFGILHCIAIGDLLALPLLGAPTALVGLLAAVVMAAPILAAGRWFENPMAVWLGLPGHLPPTLDFRPLLPWAGFILIGIVAARLAPAGPTLPRLGRPGRGLAMLGRHSLPVYLLHQAVLFPAIALLAHLVGPRAPDWLDSFETHCRLDCLDTGATIAVCEATCTCAQKTIERSPLGQELRSRAATLEDRNALGRIAGQCLRNPKP